MLNKDQIIKGCRFAKGFIATEMGDDIIGYVVSIDIENTTSIGMGAIMGEGDQNSHDHWCKIYYPFFLTRILEGINATSDKYSITINNHGVSVKNVNGEFAQFIRQNAMDHNKLCAVEYVFENMDK